MWKVGDTFIHKHIGDNVIFIIKELHNISGVRATGTFIVKKVNGQSNYRVGSLMHTNNTSLWTKVNIVIKSNKPAWF